MTRLVLALAVLAVVGCGEEVGGIRLTIENDASDPLEIGEEIEDVLLEIVGNLVADPGEAAETCWAAARPFELTGPTKVELPFDFGVRLGNESWTCVGIKVSGSLDEGTPFLLDEGYYCPSTLESEVSNYTLTLSKACHPDEAAECDAGETCLGGDCRESRLGMVFEVRPAVDYWCDGAAHRE